MPLHCLAVVLLLGIGIGIGIEWPTAAIADTLQGTVLSIGDGDTLRVMQGGRPLTVRLACIDAPELAQQPWGQASRAFLQQQLPAGRQVTLSVIDTDRHGRTVAEVSGDSHIGLALVQSGMAFLYPRHLHQCDARRYRAAERLARSRRLGVWQVQNGITRPWVFRSSLAPQRRG